MYMWLCVIHLVLVPPYPVCVCVWSRDVPIMPKELPIILLIILKESTHYSTTHSNYSAELQGIFLFRDKSDLPPSVDTEQDRRDVSGLAAIASQITVHV